MNNDQLNELLTWLRYLGKQLFDPRVADMRYGFTPNIAISLAQKKLFALLVAEEDGGLGLTHQQTAHVIEQIASFCPPLAMFIAGNAFLAARTIKHFCGENKKLHDVVQAIYTGQYIVATAVTEPQAGSHLESIETWAEPDGDSWIINGSKCWIGLAPWASAFLVYCKVSIWEF